MAAKFAALKIVRPAQAHKASVVIFHGSGDTGSGFYDWMKFVIGDFTHPHIKFLFPTAPLQPYTPLRGEKSHVWFDRKEITPFVPEDNTTLEAIGVEVKDLIQKEVDEGIERNKIIVGGFSMGGALALHTAYKFVPDLAGVFTLSSFLNNESAVYENLKSNSALANVPLHMWHGDRDSMVLKEWGESTFNTLKELGVNAEFSIVKSCMHEIKKREIIQVMDWIKTNLKL